MKLERYFFHSTQLQHLIDNLLEKGYTCIGPQLRDSAIVYDNISSVDQLPRGIKDTQAPGHYSLTTTSSGKFFDWANGPQAIKPLLFTPRENLWKCKQSTGAEITFETIEPDARPTVIIGAKSCDVAAMKIQDQHFLQQTFVDPYYKARRDNLFIVAVNCSSPADTCFCHSTGDGPFVEDDSSADIVLTELENGFLVNVQTSSGKILLDGLSLEDYTDEQLEESELIKSTASEQNRKLPEYDIKSRLFNELNNDAWHEIATKCLSCGNCTSVCPTCFCHSETDAPELDGKSSIHLREWDSCFGQGHSYIHGFTIRSETSQRYRQWITHKFSSWHEQYGRSGCVGCGRCITWCPVGIDVTESVACFEERRRG